MLGQASRMRALESRVAPTSELLALERERDTSLEWRQPRWDQYLYRLESPRGLLALMQTVGFLKLETSIETAGGCYRLQTRWARGFKLHFEDETEARCDFRPGWWFGGQLVLRDGESLRLKSQGFTAHQLETEEGFPLVGFAGSREWFKCGSELTLHDALWRRGDALELMIVGFVAVALATRRASD